VPEFVTVAGGHAPEPGEAAAFDVRGERVAVANLGGALYAFGDLCPHRQCSLADGILEGAVVTCPCHGSRFDVTTGARLRGPAVRGVRVYPVRLEDGALQLEV
jgi:3-phenylpropionate/trans-cinnamate dioxygenase ferredoxin component